MEQEKRYWTRNGAEVLNDLGAHAGGLSGEEAASRLEQYGLNQLEEEKKKSLLMVFLEQFKDLMVAILCVAAAVSFLSGEGESTLVIFAVLILNALLGTIQYTKAEKSLASLRPCPPRSPGCCETASGWRFPPSSWCPVTSCCWRRETWWWPTGAFWRTTP